jgi:hypothetical protein
MSNDKRSKVMNDIMLGRREFDEEASDIIAGIRTLDLNAAAKKHAEAHDLTGEADFKKEKLFQLIKGQGNVSVGMKSFVPGEKEEVWVLIAYFNPEDCLGEYEEMADTVASLLNSQAEVIRLQAAQIAEMKRIANKNGRVIFPTD